MQKKYAQLAGATILATMASQAVADANNIFLLQTGDANQALINQEGAFGSAVGSAGLVAQQIGSGNELLVTQTGGDNFVGQEAAGIVQDGYNNFMDLTQTGFGNVVGTAEQRGNNNRIVTFSYVEGDNNRIASIYQDNLGAAGSNQIHYGVHGDNNGHGSFTGDAAAVGLADSSFVQTGGSNNIDLQVSGQNNLVSGSQVGAGANMFYYWVNGTDNQTALSIESDGGNNIMGVAVQGGTGNNIGMRMRTTGDIGNYAGFNTTGIGANFNTMFADQFGDGNIISANSYGSYNDVDIVQMGLNNETRNEMYSGDNMTLNISQDGMDNSFFSVIDAPVGANAVFVNQFGMGNASNLDMYGDGNNTLGAPLANGASMFDTPMFTGLAGSAAGVAGLYAGGLIQNGVGNMMDVNIGTNGAPSNNNLFAIAQMGDGNSATLIMNGNNNQAAISQAGDFNVASVTQMGNGNVAGILQ